MGAPAGRGAAAALAPREAVPVPQKMPSVAAATVAPRPWPSAPRREVAAVPAGTPAASELAPASLEVLLGFGGA